MAGGLGTRMKSVVPKHLHPLLGRRVVDWVLETARASRCRPARRGRVAATRATRTTGASTVAVQEQPRGTGDAVSGCARVARRLRRRRCSSSTPRRRCSRPSSSRELVEHASGRRCGGDDPDRSSRTSRSRTGESSAPTTGPSARSSRSATPRPSNAPSRELNSSIYVFDADALWAALVEPRAEERAGRALPDRHDRAHRRRRRPRGRLALARRRGRRSGSTRASSSPQPRPSCATGSTTRTCSRA